MKHQECGLLDYDSVKVGTNVSEESIDTIFRAEVSEYSDNSFL